MALLVERRLRIAMLLGVSAALWGCVAGHTRANALLLTEKPEPDTKPLVVAVGTTIDIKLSKMRWTEIQASDQETPAPVLQRTARPLPTEDGTAAATFVAARPGKVVLMAQGRATCKTGQACPHFLVQWSRAIEIVGNSP